MNVILDSFSDFPTIPAKSFIPWNICEIAIRGKSKNTKS